MPAIVTNVLIVMIVLSVFGASLMTLGIVYALLFTCVALVAWRLAYKSRAKVVNKGLDRDLARQAKQRKQLSVRERKIKNGHSVLESRTTKQDHH